MSMVFAGFMAAAKEDRLRREDLAAEQAKDERSWQRQLDLLDITDRRQQEILDKKLAKDAAAFATLTGRPQAEVAPIVDAYGIAAATEMFQSGMLDFGPSTTTSWDGTVSQNAEIMYNTFVSDLGYDATVAAGLVGNFMQESGVGINTTAVGDGGASIGGGQWKDERATALKEFAAANNMDWTDPRTQALFTDHELKTSEKSAWEKIQAAAGDPAKVAAVASEAFWRPGVPMVENRMNYASGVYDSLYSAKIPALTDTFGSQGGLSFGEDKQMADLGLATTSPLTLSTQGSTVAGGSDPTAVASPASAASGPRLVRPEPEINEFIKGVTTLPEVATRIREVQTNPNLSEGTKQVIVAQLEAHGQSLRDLAAKDTNLADAQIFAVTVRNEDGTTRTIEATRSADGTFYETSPDGKSVPVTGKIESAQSYDLIERRGDMDAQAATFDEEFRNTRASFRDLAKQAIAMDQLVQRNESVLTTVGGAASSLVTTINSNFAAATEIISGQAAENNGYVTEAQVENAIASFEKNIGVDEGKIDQNARDYAEFKARQLRFAYAFARVTNEQAGVGLSNTDFQNALKTVSSGSTYDSFTNNLRSQVEMSIENVRSKFGDFLNDTRTINRTQLPGSAVYTKTFDQFVAEENIAPVIEWASDTTVSAPAAPDAPVDSADLNAVLNSPKTQSQISEFERSIAKEIADKTLTPQAAERLREQYAQRVLGIDLNTYRSVSGLGTK